MIHRPTLLMTKSLEEDRAALKLFRGGTLAPLTLKLAPAENASAGEDSQPWLNPEQIARLLRRLVSPTRARARIYDRDGFLLIDSRSQVRGSNISHVDQPAAEPVSTQTTVDESSALEKLLNGLRRRSPRPELPLYEDIGMGNGKSYPEVASALDGRPHSVVRIDAKGETIISVAVPIQRFRSVGGALLLSTFEGDIDTIIDSERWDVIRIFLVTASVMLALSLYFARSLRRRVSELIGDASPSS
jgi:two-component system sensor histidine kinase ChvG